MNNIEFNLKNKSQDEIFEIYKEIASDTNAQKEIYEMTQNSKVATKIYNLYKKKKEVNTNEFNRNK